MRWQLAVYGVVFTMAWVRPARAQGVIVAPNANVVRTSNVVRAELAQRVVRYEITETFRNLGGRLDEADYVFPLPAHAAFSDLKLSINGEMVSGETMDATQARGIYESIVRRQRDPALVEWMGYGMLRARIFPIVPGEEKTVVVRYDMVAPREGDALRIDYGRGSATESSFTLSYSEADGYGTAYSPTHTLSTSESNGRMTVRASGAEPEVTILLPVRRPGAEASVAMLPYAPGGDDGFALITVTPPAVHGPAVPRDLTFVLDVSGSMSGRKIAQAESAGRQILETLSPRDRFRMIDFSSDVRTFRDQWSVATRQNIDAAERYLGELEANGGTNIDAALKAALTPPVEREADTTRLSLVIFVTDGQPTVGETDPDRILRDAAGWRGRARVFTFGLGSDVNASLVEQLALAGRGTSQFVRPEESVERAVSVVASRLRSPVATDLVMYTTDGVRLTRVLPAGPVDVFEGQDVILLARYSGAGRAMLTFDGRRGDAPVSWTSAVEFPDRERANPFVARLWATQRVGYLSAERRKDGASAEVDDEIRRLGEQYGIPTELTSYLVREPQVAVTGRPAGAPVPLQQRQFDAAKTASAMRASVSLAYADSAASADDGAREAKKQVGERVFVWVPRDSAWVDARYRDDSRQRVVAIAPYSAAYFAVLDAVPALRPVLALGDRVVVVGRGVVLRVTPAGAAVVGDADFAALRAGW
jgi:Ca-activated chloride channel homolog